MWSLVPLIADVTLLMSKVSNSDLTDLQILSSEVPVLKAVWLMHPHISVMIIHSCSSVPSNE